MLFPVCVSSFLRMHNSSIFTNLCYTHLLKLCIASLSNGWGIWICSKVCHLVLWEKHLLDQLLVEFIMKVNGSDFSWDERQVIIKLWEVWVDNAGEEKIFH